MPRLTTLLLALPLCSCFADPGRYGNGDDGGGASTSSTTTTTGDESVTSTTAPTPPTDIGTTSTTTGDDSTTAPPSGSGTTGSPPDPGTTTDFPDQTSEPETTDPVGPKCGDGIVEGSEQCDDGNGLDDDGCSLGCTIASCADQQQNQGESAVDCGGPCVPCKACQTCKADADCEGEGYACIAGQCSAGATILIDYFKHCGDNDSNWLVTPYLPPGSYWLTAKSGGGSTTNQLSTFGWAAHCKQLDLLEMSTEFIYPGAAEAFAALPVTQITREITSGTLTCGVNDSTCDDNVGFVEVAITLACP